MRNHNVKRNILVTGGAGFVGSNLAASKHLKGRVTPVGFKDWRPGDQPSYVSDIRKATDRTGWWPMVSKEVGIRGLWDWVVSNGQLFGQTTKPAAAAGNEQSAIAIAQSRRKTCAF
jgi:nucleoside-diphosphate-sugar epimerase